MQDPDIINLMRQEAHTILSQIERAQSTAAATLQWYKAIGGTAWINNVATETWTAAGITKSQFKKAMDDLAWFAELLQGKWTNGPNGDQTGTWTTNDLGENLYKLHLR
jgi:hypothetical protein